MMPDSAGTRTELVKWRDYFPWKLTASKWFEDRDFNLHRDPTTVNLRPIQRWLDLRSTKTGEPLSSCLIDPTLMDDKWWRHTFIGPNSYWAQETLPGKPWDTWEDLYHGVGCSYYWYSVLYHGMVRSPVAELGGRPIIHESSTDGAYFHKERNKRFCDSYMMNHDFACEGVFWSMRVVCHADRSVSKRWKRSEQVIQAPGAHFI